MKETKIAKQKIEERELKINYCIKENKKYFIKSNYDKKNWKRICLRYLQEDFVFTLINKGIFGHKESCERFLEFLERDMFDFMNVNGTCFRIMNNKITDLKQAIKLYEKKL